MIQMARFNSDMVNQCDISCIGDIPTNPYASNPASSCFPSNSSDNADAGNEDILLVLYSIRMEDESVLLPLWRDPFPYGWRMRPSTAAKMSSFRIKPGISSDSAEGGGGGGGESYSFQTLFSFVNHYSWKT